METWTPTVRDGETLEDVTLRQWIGEALGAASMCWVLDGQRVSVGEFDSTEATRISEALHAHVQNVIDGVIIGTRKEADNKPNLGLATTREMLEELRARGDVALAAYHRSELAEDGLVISSLAKAILKTCSEKTLNYKTWYEV